MLSNTLQYAAFTFSAHKVRGLEIGVSNSGGWLETVRAGDCVQQAQPHKYTYTYLVTGSGSGR